MNHLNGIDMPKNNKQKIASLACNFNNIDENEKNYLYILENKFIWWCLCIFTLGIYPYYEWTVRHNIALRKDKKQLQKINEHIEEKFKKDNFNQKNNFFSLHYLNYINSFTFLSFLNQKKKTQFFNFLFFLINFLLVICTGGLYLIFVLYENWPTIQFHNGLNIFLKNFKEKEKKKKLKQLQNRYRKESIKIAKLNKSLKKVNDFDYGYSTNVSLQELSIKKTKDFCDPFLSFLFYFSYIFLGLITCGGFFIYCLIQKHYYKNNYNFFQNFLKHQIIDVEDFNDRVKTLTSGKIDNINVDLIFASQSNDILFDCCSIYQSVLFKHKSHRFFTILFLTFFTAGIFPIYLFAKFAFSNERNVLFCYKRREFEEIDINKPDWYWKKMSLKSMFLWRLLDDIKLFIALTISKVNKLPVDIDCTPGANEFNVAFIKTITSTWFKWLFLTVWFIFNLTFACIWGITYGFSIYNPIFTIFITSISLFFLIISIHIFLLF